MGMTRGQLVELVQRREWVLVIQCHQGRRATEFYPERFSSRTPKVMVPGWALLHSSPVPLAVVIWHQERRNGRTEEW